MTVENVTETATAQADTTAIAAPTLSTLTPKPERRKGIRKKDKTQWLGEITETAHANGYAVLHMPPGEIKGWVFTTQGNLLTSDGKAVGETIVTIFRTEGHANV